VSTKTPSEEAGGDTAGPEYPLGTGERAQANDRLLSEHDVLCTLVTALVQGNRRWQLVVFPALFAFVLLASYGFYLIYNLVEDVDKMASSVHLNLGFMTERMTQISLNLDALTGSVRDISVNLDDLTGTVTAMNANVVTIAEQIRTLPPMLQAITDVDTHIASMDESMQWLNTNVGTMSTSIQTMNNQMAAMTQATQHISGNVSGLNQNIGRPMNFMNNLMPW
jgi:prefoldin subunit 5